MSSQGASEELPPIVLEKMDARRATDNHLWDSKRVKDIESVTKNATASGSKCEFRVVQQLSPHLRRCQCTQQLLPYLKARGVLTESDCAEVLRQSGSRISGTLGNLLVQSSSDPSRNEKLTQNLYLSLLDCYEREGEAWCRDTAVHNLRPIVFRVLSITQEDYSDVRVAVSHLPPVQLPADVVAKLLESLSFGESVGSSVTDLKQLIQRCLSTRDTMSLQDVVSGLLLTPGLGRYVTHLVPYCLSNSPEVYEFLLRLKAQWKLLAKYLGYSGQEVNAIATAGRHNLRTEIQLFLRVWWMPDCGLGETEAILQSMQPVMNLWLQQVQKPKQDDGQAVLRACMSNDWSGAERLIQSGSFLGARDEEGKTPLMYACLKGNDRIVKLLIERGADPQDVDKKGNSCLHFPETLRNQTILKYLLEVYTKRAIPVDPESVESGCTPLSIACKHEAVNSAELLLEHKANPNGSTNGRHRPLVEASARGHIGLVKMMLKHHADIDLTDSRGFTPLLQACTSNHWSVAQLLMEEGANVNKCGLDCTTPLFAAVSANSYNIASQLIQKGAFVDAIRYQPGAQEGTVEVIPLAHAAAKGMTAMVDLLISSGANVNYLCSGTMPPIGFSIIGSQFDTFKQLLACPSLDRSLLGFSAPIITSVRSEKYLFTEMLLKELGGRETALKRAQQNQMSMLEEHIVIYIETMKLLGDQPPEPPPPQLQQDTNLKVEEVLYHFCQICVAAVLDNKQLHESVVEIAAATEPTVAPFLGRVLSHTQPPEDLKHDFLHGEPSPFTFLIQNRVLTADMFQIEALKFYPKGADSFYGELLWTFHQMPGGEGLPTDIRATLTQLFSGGFTPTVGSGSRRRNPSTGTYHTGTPAIAAPHSEGGATGSSIHHETNSSAKLEGLCKSTQNMYSKLSNVHKQLPPMQARQPTGRAQPYKEVHELADKEFLMKPVEEASLTNLPRISEDLGDSSTVQPPTSSGSEGNVATEAKNLNISDNSDMDNDAESEVVRTPYMEKCSDNTKPSFPEKAAAVAVAVSNNMDTLPPGTGSSQTQQPSMLLPNCKVNPTGNQLGYGSYGEVLEVEYKGKKYAAKKYRHAEQAKLFRVFGREHEILAAIRHRNIVPYFGICQLDGDGSSVIVMEKLEMNLSTYLENPDNVNIPLVQKFQVLCDIVQGLNHLHCQRPAIIHRDLTATNVLLDSKKVAKIGDFGNSRMVDLTATPEIMTSNPGTLDYMPPEALEGNVYNEKLDVFSFGHLAIYTIIQHRPHPLMGAKYRKDGKLTPRTEVERRQIFIEEVTTKLGSEKHPFFPIMSECLQDEPDCRPSCPDILEVLATCTNN